MTTTKTLTNAGLPGWEIASVWVEITQTGKNGAFGATSNHFDSKQQMPSASGASRTRAGMYDVLVAQEHRLPDHARMNTKARPVS